MKQIKPELRPATRADVQAMYGDAPQQTMRAWVATLEGRPVAIGGITYGSGVKCAFVEISEEFKPYKVSIMKFARKIHAIIGKGPCMALASPEVDGSDRLIEWLGFEFVASTQYGGVYQWQSQ